MDQKPNVHSFFAQKRRFIRREAGFSLVELLVVVSLIALILGVGAAVALKVTAEARREQTRAMMEGLIAANAQYKAVRGTKIGLDTSSGSSSAAQYVEACQDIKACEEIMMSALSSSTSTSLERIFRGGSIYDRWGTQLEYRPSNLDGSGTGPSTNVSNGDLPLSRDPFFASAGPDKTWGTDDDVSTVDQ